MAFRPSLAEFLAFIWWLHKKVVMLILKSRGAVVATAFYGAVESAKLHAALVILLSEKDKESRGR